MQINITKNMVKKTKGYFEEVSRTVDKETGEVLTIERKVKKSVPRDRFIAMYFKDIQGIIDLTSKSEFKVLIAICSMVSYNKNEIFLVKPVKEDISKKSGLKFNTVNSTLSQLYRKGMLIRKASTLYLLNPNYFFFGEEVERANIIKLTIEYTLED